ncbi:MAG TPA: hypothetical protein DCS63_05785 [Elusimicrobia bacterium]|nr:hypothetical protein [Elusimicrobiota bacterium]
MVPLLLAAVAVSSAFAEGVPLIGDDAPAFKAVTTQGPVDFPADWRPGEEVIVPPPNSCGTVKTRVDTQKETGIHCYDWFMCFKPLPKDEPKKDDR